MVEVCCNNRQVTSAYPRTPTFDPGGGLPLVTAPEGCIITEYVRCRSCGYTSVTAEGASAAGVK